MRHRIYSLTVHARFTRTRNIPEYEIPLFKMAWPGAEFTDPIPLPTTFESADDALKEYTRLLSEYGKERMESVYPSWVGLEREMRASAKATVEWLATEATAEERERVRQEDARAAVEEANRVKAEQDAEDREEAYRQRIKEEARARLEAEREAEAEQDAADAAPSEAPKAARRGRPAKPVTTTSG
jgi:hypothetical protein